MLKGKIGIKDKGVVGKEYAFEGYDISAYFGGVLDERVQFEVGMCRVRSDCDTHFELLCKLGVLVRYAKTECRAENAEGYEKNFFGEKTYTPTLKKKYIIPKLVWIELESLDICAFELENEYLKVSCESVEELKIFGILKKAHTRIFRFNEEYLGFNPYKQVVKTDINTELYRKKLESD
ncbi:MAG: hypothetical protein LBM93_04650 [Oscillospiraceae bacterium]|jgi:hypothetical protein|nr:hypothetical protein [Oscillospiraceae bacterium]